MFYDMATFKAVVMSHHKKEDGTWNIKIRVTHNRLSRYISTPYYVDKSDMTRALKLKNQKYIDATDDMIRKYRSVCDRLGERISSMSIDEVLTAITTESSNEKFDLDIIAYARRYISQLESSEHIGTANAYRVSINSLVRFVGRESVSIHEITVKFLNDWIRFIIDNQIGNNSKGGVRSPNLYIAQLRAIHNRAKKEFNDEDAGLIRIPYSPFAKVDLPKQQVSRKRAISVNSLRKLASVPYTVIKQQGTNRFNLAKDVFLLSFALIGMNAVDLYNCTNYRNGRLTYNRTKTKNRRVDHAEISIRIEPEYQSLFDKYRDDSGERVFVFYRKFPTVNAFSAALNQGLKRVGKIIGEEDLEFYAARHTWATIALNDAGVDKYTVHQALNHIDANMKVTDYYIKKSWKPIDEANRKVIDFCWVETINVDET